MADPPRGSVEVLFVHQRHIEGLDHFLGNGACVVLTHRAKRHSIRMVLASIVCSPQSTLGVRDSELIDGKTACPHHHQSKSLHDPDLFVKLRRYFL